MSGPFAFLVAFAACLLAVLGMAVLSIVAALVVAAMLPRGHRHADRLRRFAADTPKTALQVVLFLDGLAFVGALVLGALLTVGLA